MPMTLTAEQRQAVEWPGALLVHAGAGAGKTSVLAHRIAHLVTQGSNPFEILVVTFSVKAARELRSRLEDLISLEQARAITVCTLHALGLRMLREYGDVLGYHPDPKRRVPQVCPAQWRRKMLKQLINAVDTNGDPTLTALAKRLSPEEVEQVISTAKCAGLSPGDFAARGTSTMHALLAQIYADYERRLLDEQMVDFDGLILQPLCLLKISVEALTFFQARWQQVLVDECQDLSLAQYRLIGHLVERHHQLTLIGDAAQSVYAFRGALGGECFARFQHDFPEAAVIHLPHNFRSSRSIVALSDALLRDWHRQSPPQVPMREIGFPVALLTQSSEHQEAGTVTSEILRAVSCGFVSFEHCAVLCRTNAQIAPIEKALLRANVPYVVVGRGSFYDHPEIRQLIAFLRLSQHLDGDPLALAEIAVVHGWLPQSVQVQIMGEAHDLLVEHVFDHERSSTLGPAEVAGLRQLQEALLKLDERNGWAPVDLLQFVLTEAGLAFERHLRHTRGDAFQQSTERVAELLRMAGGFSTISAFLDELDVLSGENPLSTFGRDRVKLLTLHDAKGLEFRLVFLVGMEEGLIPHYNAQHSKRGLDEELRLAYVGFTRATDVLCISFAQTRNGRRVKASPFLRGLPKEAFCFRMPDWPDATANPLINTVGNATLTRTP